MILKYAMEAAKPYFRTPIRTWFSRLGLAFGGLAIACVVLATLLQHCGSPVAGWASLAYAAAALIGLSLLDNLQATIRVVRRRQKSRASGEKEYRDWSI